MTKAKTEADGQKRVRKLVSALRRDYGSWHSKPHIVELFQREPIEQLQKYASGTVEEYVAVTVELGQLPNWHFSHYISASLNTGLHRLDEFALASRYWMWSVLLEEAPAKRGRASTLLPDLSAKYFAVQLVAGWRSEALAVGQALYEGLDTGLLDLRINDQHDAGSLYRHFWFLMHLFADASRLPPIDTTLYSYPKDMAPYAQVLADWRTKDTAQVKRWVEEMAEFHLRQTGTPDPYGKQEFDFPDAQLFPYEILAFLRLREWSNLPNPTRFDHPLMNQPLAHLPKDVPLPQPDTPLLDAVIERYRVDYPELRTGA